MLNELTNLEGLLGVQAKEGSNVHNLQHNGRRMFLHYFYTDHWDPLDDVPCLDC